MQYYVSNSREPMEVPWGFHGALLSSREDAIQSAIESAQTNPGRFYYVHEFPESTVVYFAEGRVEVSKGWICENPQQG